MSLKSWGRSCGLSGLSASTFRASKWPVLATGANVCGKSSKVRFHHLRLDAGGAEEQVRQNPEIGIRHQETNGGQAVDGGLLQVGVDLVAAAHKRP